MIGFHSQNVLQTLENMQPIIFRINAPDGPGGYYTFNKVEGMTLLEAFNLLIKSGYGKEGDKPVVPILRISSEEPGSGYYFTADFIGFLSCDFNVNITNPTQVNIMLPAIGVPYQQKVDQFYWPIYGSGNIAPTVLAGISLTKKSGNNVTVLFHTYE